jgi:hypothetical protein
MIVDISMCDPATLQGRQAIAALHTLNRLRNLRSESYKRQAELNGCRAQESLSIELEVGDNLDALVQLAEQGLRESFRRYMDNHGTDAQRERCRLYAEGATVVQLMARDV